MEPELSLDEQFNQACRNGQHDVVDNLLGDGYIPKSQDLCVACERGDLDLVLKILAYHVSGTLDFRKGFITAVISGNSHLLDHLYLHVDINSLDDNGNNALHGARDIKVTKWLLDMGCSQIPNNDSYTPLDSACICQDIEVFELLLQHKSSNLDTYGDTLHIACRLGQTTMVRMLLQHMPSIDEANDDGETALHIACRYGRIGIVELLLQHTPTVKDKASLLQLAQIYDHKYIYQLLLDHFQDDLPR